MNIKNVSLSESTNTNKLNASSQINITAPKLSNSTINLQPAKIA